MKNHAKPSWRAERRGRRLPGAARAALVVLSLGLLLSCGQNSVAPAGGGDLLHRDDTIKNAWLDIENDQPDRVRQTVYARLGDFGASVVSEDWTDDRSIRFSGSMDVRLPSARFLAMVDWLKQTFAVRALQLRAREQQPGDEGAGAVSGGVAYSEIRISISRDIGFGGAFGIGLESAAEALKTSLRTIVPVIVFLLPYAAVAVLVIVAVRLARRGGRGKK